VLQVYALCVGLFGGSMLVPLCPQFIPQCPHTLHHIRARSSLWRVHGVRCTQVPLSFLPPDFQGIKGLGFIPSFGTGSLIMGTLFAAILRLCAGPQTLAPKATLWAGIVSGCIW
jgi:hypothetical protein